MNSRTVPARVLVLFGITSILFLVGCGGGASLSGAAQSDPSPMPTASNATPTINSLSPSCAPKGGQVLNPFVNGQLLVNGQNFFASSIVRWNGSDRPTTLSGSGQLTAQISASDIAAVGTAAVTVFNSGPGGGSSNTSTFTITTGGVGPQSIAVDAGKFAYVANEGCGDSAFGNVTVYTIDSTTGVLTSIGPPVVSNDEGAHSVSVDHFGKFVYVANWGEGDTAGSVSAYTVNATTGALTSVQIVNGTCPGLCAPWSVVVDPSGKFAYVADEGGFAPTGVSMFMIDAMTGTLTSTGTIPTGGRAVSLAADPQGNFTYVTTQSEPPGSTGAVSMYSINAANGDLTPIGTIPAGTNPASVAVDPMGKFAYVANTGSNDVSMYNIHATTGALTSMGPIAAGTGPVSVAVDQHSGKFVYVVNSGSNDVSTYSINATTGVLTLVGRTAAGLSPTSIAIHPSGKFAYVTNSGSNDVSMYSIDLATGALTLIGTVGT